MGSSAIAICPFFIFMNYMKWLKNYSTENIVEYINDECHFEKWIPIPNTGYLISSFGRLKRKSRIGVKGKKISEIIRKISLCNRYLKIVLHGKNYLIHRLVCSAFHPNTENKPQVNHKDAIKWNNFYLNLEWSTQSENIIHAQNAGILPFAKPKPILKRKCEKNIKTSHPKLVIDINTGIFYDTNELSIILGIKRKYVTRILREERKPNISQYRYA